MEVYALEDELEGDPAEDVGDVEQGLEVSPGEVGRYFSPELGREAAGRAFDVPQPRLRTRPFVLKKIMGIVRQLRAWKQDQ